MNIKKLLFYIIGTILLGGLFSFLTINNETYESLIKPALTPPMIVFPIVWSILFILMGISLYMATKDIYNDTKLYFLYLIQLVVNSLWTLLFFGFNLRLFSFIWLFFLLFLVIWMVIEFYKYNKLSAYLQIPYILWIIFASYLNLGLYLLNR